MILPSASAASLSIPTTQPAGLLFALGLAAAAAYILSALVAPRLGSAAALSTTVVAWLLHAATLAVSLTGDLPRFGFAPALSMTAWLVALLYGVERQFIPQLRTRWTLCAIGAAAVLLALIFPGKPLHPGASFWLPLHWAFGIASYGLFGVAVAHAWLMRRAEGEIRLAHAPASGVPLMTLERLTFRFVAGGFVLLTATLTIALLFSEQLYGNAVARRWDHKTVFSILSWVAFAVLLLGRARFGWRGRVAVRMLYLGAGLLLLAYVGSRFVLEVLLGRAS
jgi:ABC-type uncharacterized transport system permease subunit